MRRLNCLSALERSLNTIDDPQLQRQRRPRPSTVSNWCLVAAIAALGMKTSLRDLAIVGWRPIALMAFETMWIAALVVVALLLRR